MNFPVARVLESTLVGDNICLIVEREHFRHSSLDSVGAVSSPQSSDICLTVESIIFCVNLLNCFV